MTSGTLYGLGVGPGDPELITLKAWRILQDAPVIAWPAPEQGPSMARAIAESHIPAGRVEIAIRMPISAARFPAQAVYDDAAVEISAHLRAGRDVAVLCEGDPFLYGSFMYLYGRLAAEHECVVVPGISSLMAAAAASGAPLVARNDVLTVVPGTLSADDLKARLAGVEAAAILKIGRNLPKVRAVLDDLGLTGCATYVERATSPEQKVLSLAEAPADGAPYFSLILVHRRGDAWRVEDGDV